MKRYNSDSFKDFLFILLLSFFVLLCLVLMLPKNPNIASEATISKKAEFIISMNWDDSRNVDMDLWVMFLNIKKPFPVFFNNLKKDHIFLEQDDLGVSTDTFTNIKGEIQETFINEEIITIRAIAEGEYVINAHVYNGRGLVNSDEPLSVTVKITKLNPYKEIDNFTITFEHSNQEETFAVISIDENGNVTDISRTRFNLVSLALRSMGNQ